MTVHVTFDKAFLFVAWAVFLNAVLLVRWRRGAWGKTVQTFHFHCIKKKQIDKCYHNHSWTKHIYPKTSTQFRFCIRNSCTISGKKDYVTYYMYAHNIAVIHPYLLSFVWYSHSQFVLDLKKINIFISY